MYVGNFMVKKNAWMSMETRKNFNDMFKRSFLSAFDALGTKYGINFIESPERVFTGRSDKCEVIVAWDRPLTIDVSIKPPY